MAGTSAIAVGFVLTLGAPTSAFAQSEAPPAQTDDAAVVDEVVVTGIRGALRSAQRIKRDADTVVDSITATDIGSFPDKSVAEALQRVAGVTVNRYAATSDTTHFSNEPSGVLVRGLSQVRSEFNGRDTFSANSSRGLSWGDVSPELMSGVDTYKNQTAELIEGGIAGTINLRTRLPFDVSGRQAALTVTGNYGSLAEEITPEVSAIFSDRFQTSIGEFGVMANLAYSELSSVSESAQYGRMGVFENVTALGGGTKYIPSWYRVGRTEFDRTRQGLAGAVQYRDNSGRFQATLQYNRSTYENVWHEQAIKGSAFTLYGQPTDYVITDANYATTLAAAPGSTFTFDDEGNFETGVLNSPIGWAGLDNASAGAGIGVTSDGSPIINACYSWAGCSPETRGGEVESITRYNRNEQMTEDLSLNMRWDATDRLSFMADIQYVNATVTNLDQDVSQIAYANIAIDATGEHPTMTLTPGTNNNYADGFLSNPNAWRFNNVNDHTEDSEGNQLAVRGDMEYKFDEGGWLDSLKAGVRYADREQTVRWSAYNWGGVANAWGCDSFDATSTNSAWYNVDSTTGGASVNGDCNASTPNTTFAGWDAGLASVQDFPEIFGGLVSGGPYSFTSWDFLESHEALSNAFAYDSVGVGSSRWTPVCRRAGEVDGCYLPQEIAEIKEETAAVYAMLKFGGPDTRIGGYRISGNIGARYVETKDSSDGYLIHADLLRSTSLDCRANTAPPGSTTPVVPQTIGCYISADDIAFSDGLAEARVASVKHKNFLPSFNLRVDLTDTWLMRFAASRAMSRPDIGYLKNYLQVGISLPSTDDPNDERWVKDASGNIVGVTPRYTAEAYNPYLKPITADQFDLTLENYFADTGSFSLALFYKKFNDYIQYGTYDQSITIDGVTRDVQVRGPVNGDGASLHGAEVAFQSFFPSLPSPFDGLGVQANFTYVENSGISNSNLTNVSSGGGSNTSGNGVSQASDSITTDSLEGLSKYSFNLVGLYEKGPWAARVAYNWRSEFLLSAVDCCIGLPIWQEAAGYLDASLRYKINDHAEVNLQASNLLDTESVLKQQVTDAEEGGLLKDYSWNRTDRRFMVTLRLRY
ncbi:TonB-dependent receptor [Brevundimonas sp. SL130]|uniref:TonB-dependent receptor n=1 Tax=Brevundimonas sp. SL130 TaxID=2995143 RepID=UPI00226CD333|nr:TonB-dependent receptor [Brevundimonas sp. SL130]WAC58603.1 TonB-dependent receptor [Brevundimonas sp. SL130]